MLCVALTKVKPELRPAGGEAGCLNRSRIRTSSRTFMHSPDALKSGLPSSPDSEVQHETKNLSQTLAMPLNSAQRGNLRAQPLCEDYPFVLNILQQNLENKRLIV
jgi:hypothetical protein